MTFVGRCVGGPKDGKHYAAESDRLLVAIAEPISYSVFDWPTSPIAPSFRTSSYRWERWHPLSESRWVWEGDGTTPPPQWRTPARQDAVVSCDAHRVNVLADEEIAAWREILDGARKPKSASR